MNPPILLMTFAANDLKGVKTETDKIWKSVKNNTYIKAQKVNNVTIDKLADNVIDCGRDLFMFHFGGHADQKRLVLDGLRGIDKIRLSRILLLNEQHNVQIIFLNGCLSYGHVGILTAKGVKAIIATNVEVNDIEAVRIAAYFYKLFFEKDYTLKEAFETAEATVSGKNAYITIVNPGEIDEKQPLPSAWSLFIHAQHQAVMNWKLADFLKVYANDTPSVSQGQNTPSQTIQNHSGSGDNVAGDKIGRQINMGSGSTYIENAANTTTTSVKSKDGIENLVAHGKLGEALAQIAAKSDDSTIILLQSRLARLERAENLGIIDARDANIERNRIASAILSLLKELT